MSQLCASCNGRGFNFNEPSGTPYRCAICYGSGTVNNGSPVLHVPTERLELVIAAEHYWQVPGTFITVCALVLENGFTVMGKAGCATADEFDAEIGKRWARQNAKREIKPLECYALRERFLKPSTT